VVESSGRRDNRRDAGRFTASWIRRRDASALVLSINVEDLDLDNKRVRVRSKGGDLDWLHFQTGSARLLPRLIAGRTRGPLFLADRAPAPARAPATIDRCPEPAVPD
jgi:hypothetical protein